MHLRLLRTRTSRCGEHDCLSHVGLSSDRGLTSTVVLQWLEEKEAAGDWLQSLLALNAGDWRQFMNGQLGGIKGAELLNWCAKHTQTLGSVQS